MATISRTGSRILIETDCLQAEVHTEGYVSGVAAGTLLDKQTGARDLGMGLDIVDFLLEPGWDDGTGDYPYSRDVAVHGNLPKRYVELPQICTQAGHLEAEMILGEGFVAVKQWYRYTEATGGRQPGSLWEQWLVFPDGQRFFFAADRITSVNTVANLILRTDLPGHLRHEGGDSFAQIYLSYHGHVPAAEFVGDFPPDGKYLYQRQPGQIPQHMIRAYQVRLGGQTGPWLGGLTLDPSQVSEAWCHQRGYVCFIQEIGGRNVAAGESFGAAYAIGYFDTIAEMEQTCEQYRGATGLDVAEDGFRLV
jgi:hypothetical protein